MGYFAVGPFLQLVSTQIVRVLMRSSNLDRAHAAHCVVPALAHS